MPIYFLHALFRVNNYLIVEILRYSLVANVFLPHVFAGTYSGEQRRSVSRNWGLG